MLRLHLIRRVQLVVFNVRVRKRYQRVFNFSVRVRKRYLGFLGLWLLWRRASVEMHFRIAALPFTACRTEVTFSKMVQARCQVTARAPPALVGTFVEIDSEAMRQSAIVAKVLWRGPKFSAVVTTSHFNSLHFDNASRQGWGGLAILRRAWFWGFCVLQV